jgi:hypothetical protein
MRHTGRFLLVFQRVTLQVFICFGMGTCTAREDLGRAVCIISYSHVSRVRHRDFPDFVLSDQSESSCNYDRNKAANLHHPDLNGFSA